MQVIIIAIIAAMFAIGWFKYKTTALVLAYYMETKKYMPPTDEELQACTEFVIRNMFKDLIH